MKIQSIYSQTLKCLFIFSLITIFISNVYNQESISLHHYFLMGNDENINIRWPYDSVCVPRYDFQSNTAVLQILDNFTYDAFPKYSDSIYQEALSGYTLSMKWQNPPVGAIIDQSYNITFETKVFTYIDTIHYPIDVPDKYLEYLKSDGLSQSDNLEIINLGKRIKGDQTLLIDIIASTCRWLHDSITPGVAPIGPDGNYYGDAYSTYLYRKGICGNFSYLAVAILRSLGIPSNVQNGLIGYNSFSGHAWIKVYIPYYGWVEFEPQESPDNQSWYTNYFADSPAGFVGVGNHFSEFYVNEFYDSEDMITYKNAINSLYKNQITNFKDSINHVISTTENGYVKGTAIFSLATYYASIDSFAMAYNLYNQIKNHTNYNGADISSIQAIIFNNTDIKTKVLSVGQFSVVAGGTISTDTITILERGVCWGPGINPTLENCINFTTDGSGPGEFNSSITGLLNQCTYHIRAYATSTHGTKYGDDIEIYTPIPSLIVSPSLQAVSSTSGTTTFIVTSNIDWSANESCDWLTATKTNSTTLTINYNENTSVDQRSASITLSGAGVTSQIVAVNQNGATSSLIVSPPSQTVDSAAGTTTFAVSSNIDWSVSESYDWLTATKTNSTTLTVNYNENTGVDQRSASITLSGTGVTSQIVTVKQNGIAPSLIVSPPSQTVDSAAGTTTFAVSSNIDWSVSENYDWLTATKTNSTTLTVNYNDNTSVDQRSASITLSGTGVTSQIVTMNQNGVAPSLIVSPPSQIVSSSSGTAAFTVTSNIDWSVSESYDWLTATKTNTKTLTMNYNENTSVDQRSAEFIISGFNVDSVTINLVQEGNIPNSISTVIENIKILIFPNPTDGLLYFKFESDSETDITVTIYDGIGQMMYNQEFINLSNQETISIDFSEYKNGLYILRFNNQTEIKIKKVIKE